jgi:hypothetical protein
MHSVCVAEPDVTVNYTKILIVTQQYSCEIYIAGNNKIYLDLRPEFPDIFARI